ncbi:MAG: hypothetical protein OXC19_23445 [Bryobacterales bacterium]|nr:hypothetical protein [Bryobacterales bacterium]
MFKVFAYVYRRVEWASGCLKFEQAALARDPGNSQWTLDRCLRELAVKGICDLEAASN